MTTRPWAPEDEYALRVYRSLYYGRAQWPDIVALAEHLGRDLRADQDRALEAAREHGQLGFLHWTRIFHHRMTA